MLELFQVVRRYMGNKVFILTSVYFTVCCSYATSLAAVAKKVLIEIGYAIGLP